jgi:hypothetical protein
MEQTIFDEIKAEQNIASKSKVVQSVCLLSKWGNKKRYVVSVKHLVLL